MVWGAIYLAIAGLARHFAGSAGHRAVGTALILSSLATSLVFVTLPFAFEPTVEITLAVAIALIAYSGWLEQHRGFRFQAILALAAVDVLFCAAICLEASSDKTIRDLFRQTTNGIFALQCAFVGGPGVWNYVVGRHWPRLRRWLSDRRAAAADILVRTLGGDS